MSVKPLIDMAIFSIRQPREGLRSVMNFDVPKSALWPALALVIAVSVLLAYASLLLSPVDLSAGEALIPSPFALALVLGASMMLTVLCIFWIGRFCGGKASFDDVLLAVVWLQMIMILLQGIQVLAALILPPLADFLSIAAFVVMFWLMTQFITEVHGFDSAAKVFFMMIVSMFGIVIGLTIILTLIGVGGGI